MRDPDKLVEFLFENLNFLQNLESVKVCQIDAALLCVEGVPAKVEGAVEPLLVLALVHQRVGTASVEEHTTVLLLNLALNLLSSDNHHGGAVLVLYWLNVVRVVEENLW